MTVDGRESSNERLTIFVQDFKKGEDSGRDKNESLRGMTYISLTTSALLGRGKRRYSIMSREQVLQ